MNLTDISFVKSSLLKFFKEPQEHVINVWTNQIIKLVTLIEVNLFQINQLYIFSISPLPVFKGECECLLYMQLYCASHCMYKKTSIDFLNLLGFLTII